jgi:hypothetical protein
MERAQEDFEETLNECLATDAYFEGFEYESEIIGEKKRACKK